MIFKHFQKPWQIFQKSKVNLKTGLFLIFIFDDKNFLK